MKCLLVFVTLVSVISALDDSERFCTTASCVHASSTILRNMNTSKDPCDDFYDYACGEFAEELGVPDEKATINTLNRITERVLEFINGLADVDLIEGEPKTHRISKVFYKSCLDTSTINELGKKPLEDLLKKLGGWPMLEGSSWNTKWDWNDAIKSMKNLGGAVDLKGDFFSDADNSLISNLVDVDARNVEAAYKDFLISVIRILKTTLSDDELRKDVDELVAFEKKLGEFTQKYRRYEKAGRQKNNGKLPKPYFGGYRDISWLDQFQPSVFSNGTAFKGGEESVKIVKEFDKFFANTPKRIKANYLNTRIVSRGVYYLGEEFRNAILKYDQTSNGNEDYEQRWKLCGVFITDLAPVAIGSMYIKEYFSYEEKRLAQRIMDHIVKVYQENIKSHKTIPENYKDPIKNYITKMHKFVGYADELETKQGEKNEGELFYKNFPDFPESKFFNFAMALRVHNANRAHNYTKAAPDWTKYSKPSTANAFFNGKDNSIQFPAGIIQDPNFDLNRPACMNFGALGGIISHELSHSLDTVTASGDVTNELFKNIKNCIVDQYSKQRVLEVEEYSNGTEVYLRGNQTIREDFADMGAVKLSYDAYKSWEAKNDEYIPVGLNNFTLDQIFWISHAQTFCAFERVSTTKFKVEEGKYSVERFRVLVPLRNSEEFARSFNCKAGSKMTLKDEEKCLLW